MEPHELDLISLVAGLIFIAIGAGQLLGVDTLDMLGGVGRLWPLLIIFAGVAMLAVARRTRRR